jgi:hypothetical protein
MEQLDEVRAFIADPQTDIERLNGLLVRFQEQLVFFDSARKVIHENGMDGWSYEVFQESLRVGSDEAEGDLTRAEWDAMREDAKVRLRDRCLRSLNEKRKTFVELQGLLQKELARRASGAPATSEPKKSRWPFKKR